MDLLFIILVLGFIGLMIHAAPPPKTDGKVQDGKFIKVTRVKKCPPHQWKWIDMVDQDGVKTGEQLVCLDCGPLQSQSGRE